MRSNTEKKKATAKVRDDEVREKAAMTPNPRDLSFKRNESEGKD